MQTATKIPDFQPIFNILYCCQNAFASGALPRTPPGGFQLPQLANVGSHHCRGPHRIAGPRAPRPHDPPLVKWCVFCQDTPVSMVEFASESRDEQLRLYPRDHDFTLTVITFALRLRRDELIGQERAHVM